jgi:hypothetical protein
VKTAKSAGIESAAFGVQNLVAPKSGGALTPAPITPMAPVTPVLPVTPASPVLPTTPKTPTVKAPHGTRVAQMMKELKDPSDKLAPAKAPQKKGILRRLKPMLGL